MKTTKTLGRAKENTRHKDSSCLHETGREGKRFFDRKNTKVEFGK